MKILEEIRQQPEHIRHVFMWLGVVITFSLVSFVWFRSTEEKFVAMLHPEEYKQLQALHQLAAKQTENGPSPLASLRDSFSFLRASLGELLGGRSTTYQTGNPVVPSTPPTDYRFLPLSPEK